MLMMEPDTAERARRFIFISLPLDRTANIIAKLPKNIGINPVSTIRKANMVHISAAIVNRLSFITLASGPRFPLKGALVSML
jgi:hypothetical protein